MPIRNRVTRVLVRLLTALETRRPGSVEAVVRRLRWLMPRRSAPRIDFDERSRGQQRPVEARLTGLWAAGLMVPSPDQQAAWYPSPGNLFWAVVAICVLGYFGYTVAANLSKDWIPGPDGDDGPDDDDPPEDADPETPDDDNGDDDTGPPVS